MLRKLFFLFFVFLIFTSLHAKTVKVGYYKDSGNFMSGMSEEDPRAGFAYEYIQTVASYAGWDCQYVYGEWEYLYRALVNGEIDVLTDVSYSPERKNEILYANYPMGQESYYLYSNDRHSNISAGDYSSWKGKKIGVNKDYYHYKLFMEWQKDKKLDCQYIFFGADDQYYDMFARHEFDLLVDIDIVAESDWNPVVRIGSSDFYIAVTKGRKDLHKELNEALDEIFAMNPYYNNNLWLKYFTDTTITKSISQRESDWLLSHPVIKVGCMEDDLPFASFNAKTGKAEGLVVEMLDSCSGTLLQDRSVFDYIFYKDYKAMLSDLKNGIIDVMVPAYRNLNYAERHGLILSEPFSTVVMSYAYKNNTLPDYLGKIAIPRNLRIPDYIESCYPDTKTEIFDTYEDCLDAVLANKVDGAVFNTYKVHGLINRNKKYRKMNAIDLSVYCDLSFVFTKENRELFALLNKMLMLIPIENISTAMEKFAVEEQNYTQGNFLKDYLGQFVFFSIVLFLLFAALMLALKKIQSYIYFDTLTRLLNRKRLNALIDKLFHHAKNGGGLFSLILFDIDNFKNLNDTYGHAFGDQVLVAVASVIKSYTPKKDWAFRWGGEEFLILCKGESSLAAEIAEKIRFAVEKLSFSTNEKIVRVTVTVGVAGYEPGINYIDLFRNVDEKLYQGKHNGKNQVVS
ncbi:MAG: GGDEF domain-containing protein [Treponema sp.]|nr:GGDEF domain-containing protein [Treponema sp.]